MNARQARDVERWALEDAAAKAGHVCLLCGGRAVVQGLEPGTHGDGHTIDVWELCQTCNSAFHFLAVGLQLLQDLPAGPTAEQVAGQLELKDAPPSARGTLTNLGRVEVGHCILVGPLEAPRGGGPEVRAFARKHADHAEALRVVDKTHAPGAYGEGKVWTLVLEDGTVTEGRFGTTHVYRVPA